MKTNQHKSSCAAAAVLCLLIAGSPPSSAKLLPMPTYIAWAKKSLPKGAVLTRDNINVTSTTDTDKIPPRAMWLTGAEEAYGFALQQPVAKDAPVTGEALISHFNDLTPSADDDLWKKYAKSAVVSDKRRDFVNARKYRDGAFTELAKLGAQKKHLMSMGDMFLVFDIVNPVQENSEETKRMSAESSNDLARIRSVPSDLTFDMNKLKERQKTLEEQMKKTKNTQLSRIRDRLAKAERVYPIVSAVFPPTCQLVRISKENLDTARKSLAETMTMQQKVEESNRIGAATQQKLDALKAQNKERNAEIQKKLDALRSQAK